MDIDQWTYQNINHVMHYPDSLELTEDQKTELAKKKKEIVLTNTRLEDEYNKYKYKFKYKYKHKYKHQAGGSAVEDRKTDGGNEERVRDVERGTGGESEH